VIPDVEIVWVFVCEFFWDLLGEDVIVDLGALKLLHRDGKRINNLV
jgi:hypothetical protein